MFGQQSYTPQFELPDYAAQRLQLFQVNHVLQQDAMARAAELQRQQANIAGASYLENPTDANLALVVQQDPETATRLGQFVSSRASAQAQSQYTDILRASQEQKNTLQQAQQALGLVNTAQGINDPNARNAALQAAYGMVPSSLQDGLERVLAGGGQTDRSLQNLSQVLGGFIGPGELTPQQIEQLGGAGGVTQALTPENQKRLGGIAKDAATLRLLKTQQEAAQTANIKANTARTYAEMQTAKEAAKNAAPKNITPNTPVTPENAEKWTGGSNLVQPTGAFARFQDFTQDDEKVRVHLDLAAITYTLSNTPVTLLNSGGAANLYGELAMKVKQAGALGALDRGVMEFMTQSYGRNPSEWNAQTIERALRYRPEFVQKLRASTNFHISESTKRRTFTQTLPDRGMGYLIDMAKNYASSVDSSLNTAQLESLTRMYSSKIPKRPK
jgi:hypothetical protein